MFTVISNICLHSKNTSVVLFLLKSYPCFRFCLVSLRLPCFVVFKQSIQSKNYIISFIKTIFSKQIPAKLFSKPPHFIHVPFIFSLFQVFLKTIGPFLKTIDPFLRTIGVFLKTIDPFLKTIGVFLETIGVFLPTIDLFLSKIHPGYLIKIHFPNIILIPP